MASSRPRATSDMAGLKEYKYEDLPDQRSFRIIELFAGHEQDGIVCEIRVVRHGTANPLVNSADATPTLPVANSSNFGDHSSRGGTSPGRGKATDFAAHSAASYLRSQYFGTPYEALSYTWEGTDKIIQLNTNGHRRKFSIQSNLESALRQLRYSNQSRFLWVDSICINQANKVERNHQVGDMAIIYANAQQVLIWLGPETDDSDLAFDHIQEILDLEQIDVLTQKENSAVLARWAALFSLIRRRWFNRRWVVQEVALAKKALFHCGSRNVTWDDFADAVQLFASSAREIDQLFKSSKEYKTTSNYLGDMASLGAVRLVKMQVLRSFTTGRRPERLLTLEELVSNLTVFDALDPRDTVYALVALARDANAKPLDEEPHEVKGSPLKRPKRSDSDGLKAGPYQKRQNLMVNPDQPHAIFSEPIALSPLAQSPLVADNGYDIPLSAPSAYPLPPTPNVMTPLINVRTDSASSYFSSQDGAMNMVRGFIRNLKVKVDKKRLEISYQKPVYEVFKDFLQLAFRTSGADYSPLDIICRPWAPVLKGKDAAEKLPSWMRNVSGASFGIVKNATSGRIYQRQNADPLVGSPGTTRHLYTASKSVARMPRFEEDPQLKVLSVRGFLYDRVASSSFYSSGGNIPSAWIDFVDWQDAPDNPPEEFWRTLVADRHVNGERAPPLYKRALKYLYTRAENQYTDLMPRTCLNGEPPKFVVELVERLEAVVWNRCLMRTRDKHCLGLGPRDLKEGDLVCILFGCSVPVLLREFTENGQKGGNQGGTGGNGGEKFYKFLGECYVHGIMDGEALDLPAAERKEVSFRLR